MQTSLNITYADSSLKKSTKSLTYINPEATNAQLETAASLFSAISQNDYVGAERIERIDVSEPEPTPTVKPDPTFTPSYAGGHNISYTYTGEATMLFGNYQYITIQSGSVTDGYVRPRKISSHSIEFCEYPGGNPSLMSNFQGTVTVYSPETENYAAKEFTVTVQGGSI